MFYLIIFEHETISQWNIQVKYILNPPLCNQNPNNDKIAIERSPKSKDLRGKWLSETCDKVLYFNIFLPIQVSAHRIHYWHNRSNVIIGHAMSKGPNNSLSDKHEIIIALLHSNDYVLILYQINQISFLLLRLQLYTKVPI